MHAAYYGHILIQTMLLAVHKLVVFRNVWEPIYKYHCVFCYPHIATEYRNWLLHYSVPVLKGALPAHYFLHYTMLVTAIATLVSDQISQQKLQQADKLLENFCKLMPELYGKFELLFYNSFNIVIKGNCTHNQQLACLF